MAWFGPKGVASMLFALKSDVGHGISTKLRRKSPLHPPSLQLKSYAMLIAVMVPREKWTDEHIDEGFARLDTDIRELRGEINDLRTEMNARFDAQNRNMMAGFFMVIVTILGSNAF